MNRREFISYMDYTLLTPTATKERIKSFCEEAIAFGFNTVFVNPYYASYARFLLHAHEIKVGIPVGFSLGGAVTSVKVEEAKQGIKDGAQELDMLMNLSAFKSKEFDVVKRDIQEVVHVANGLTTKVIIETALLTKEEKILATVLIIESGADFVKTSTGFNGGATIDDVRLLRSIAKDDIGIKAAGGIKTYHDAIQMIKAGASRIGSSNAIALVREEV
ncbi:deoxyribose-phosphate aldolase [Virgibacillus dokdonensis]|uniref:Deoxyribose-phosphate aldolase n=1 Tax=Virgibacillus dokdonensis TaxID=302167 RepID=A0A3E0WP80_9BACI|nr:deoxyribose-phosphate aldolase [Virgibacillus dokdonensis]RFA34790.1 deoxyribose-phosphate aldolase [Virgibacillus dokdonensis]